MGRDALGEFEHQVLLAILRLDGETYTVPIVVELERVTSRDLAPAAVYIALRRLENKGLVTSRYEDPEVGEGGRAKRLFRVSPEGLERLKASRRNFVELWSGLEALKEG